VSRRGLADVALLGFLAIGWGDLARNEDGAQRSRLSDLAALVLVGVCTARGSSCAWV
jgi:hypothetical protein